MDIDKRNIDKLTSTPSPDGEDATGHTLTCAECCAQLPPAQATNFEMDDYVLYFCSATCFQKWQALAGNAARPGQAE